MVIHHSPEKRKSLPTRISVPSEGCVGGTPTPRKDSVASVMIAEATWMVASTSTGPITLGSTWRSMMRADDTPITRAACTYSLLRSTIVEPRTVRAYCTQPGSAMARISTAKASVSCAFGNSARPTPSISSAIRIDGNDSITSQTRMISASTRPPTKPDSRPSPTPSTTDTTTEARPTSSEMRAPYIIADSTSRPWSSVPSRYLGLPSASQAGGRRASTEFSDARSKGLCGATQGANSGAEDAHQRHRRRGHGHRRGAEAVPDVAVEESLQGLGHGPSRLTSPRST